MSEGHVKMKAETGIKGLQVFQEQEEARKDPPTELLEESYDPANHLIWGF